MTNYKVNFDKVNIANPINKLNSTHLFVNESAVIHKLALID